MLNRSCNLNHALKREGVVGWNSSAIFRQLVAGLAGRVALRWASCPKFPILPPGTP